MIARSAASIAFLFLGLQSALTLEAQTAEQAPRVSLKILTKAPAPNSTVKGLVTIVFAEGLHGYQNPPTMDYQIPVTVQSDSKGNAIKPVYPKGTIKEFAGEKSAVYEGTVEIPFTFAAPKKAGTSILTLKVGYQQCNDSGCFPPAFKTISLNVIVKTAPKKLK
jgi:DsbC/DsbD-like thiol-disulfide interchange protein